MREGECTLHCSSGCVASSAVSCTLSHESCWLRGRQMFVMWHVMLLACRWVARQLQARLRTWSGEVAAAAAAAGCRRGFHTSLQHCNVAVEHPVLHMATSWSSRWLPKEASGKQRAMIKACFLCAAVYCTASCYLVIWLHILFHLYICCSPVNERPACPRLFPFHTASLPARLLCMLLCGFFPCLLISSWAWFLLLAPNRRILLLPGLLLTWVNVYKWPNAHALVKHSWPLPLHRAAVVPCCSSAAACMSSCSHCVAIHWCAVTAGDQGGWDLAALVWLAKQGPGAGTASRMGVKSYSAGSGQHAGVPCRPFRSYPGNHFHDESLSGTFEAKGTGWRSCLELW